MISRLEEGSPPAPWTVAELLQWTEGYFTRLSLPTPRLDAEILLARALGCTRLDLYTGYQRPVDSEERARFRELVKRRARREPVAYLVGQREFYSLSFEVTPAVLIPRPETEHLVEFALKELGSLKARSSSSLRVLDLGTGSGNIAIAVAVNAPWVHVDAVDSSARALEIARRNALRHGVADRVCFYLGDLLAPLPGGSPPYVSILSNPPYVSKTDYASLMDDVRLYEPPAALCDSKSEGGDGLGYYRAMAAGCSAYVDPQGFLAVEVGAGQAAAVAEIFDLARWKLANIIADYAGIDRVVVVRPRREASAPCP